MWKCPASTVGVWGAPGVGRGGVECGRTRSPESGQNRTPKTRQYWALRSADGHRPCVPMRRMLSATVLTKGRHRAECVVGVQFMLGPFCARTELVCVRGTPGEWGSSTTSYPALSPGAHPATWGVTSTNHTLIAPWGLWKPSRAGGMGSGRGRPALVFAPGDWNESYVPKARIHGGRFRQGWGRASGNGK